MGSSTAISHPPGRIVSINPASGVPLGDVPDMGVDAVRNAVAAARAAQREWASVPVEQRCRHLVRFAEVLMERSDEVIELLVKEMGKTRQEALGMEVVVVADLTRYFCKHGPKILAPEAIPLHLMKQRSSYLHFAPRGVVGVIAPWNFPFSIPLSETIMALIAGNGVVMKPSEVTPLIALKAKELLDAAGVPPALVQVVTGRGNVGAALIDAGINYCVFTGSVATGRRVAAACGERLIPCTLELGGKAPAIVCADADLDRTVAGLVWGAFANSGQVCASVERVFVVDEIHDTVVERVVAQTQALRQGDGDTDVDVGAMAWDRQVEHVARLVEDAVKAGAHVACGGTRHVGRGQFYPPTVLTGVRPDMDIARREIFGPVMPIIRVHSEEEALALANDLDLGLTAYVFSRDGARARRLADRIEAGTVMINDVLSTFALPETPWSGVKHSGIGRTHSALGLRDLCETRHVNYDRIRTGRDPWWYPYRPKTFALFHRAAKLLFGRRPWQRPSVD